MKKLRVDFDNPEHGWIGISISDDIETVTIDADSKSHSFHELTTALIGLMDERGEFTVTWLEEPVESQWKFQKHHDIIVFEFWRSVYAQPIIQFAGSYESVCFPFWRALQFLRGRFSAAGLEEKLQDKFPFGALDRLTAQIQVMKAQTRK